MSVDEQTETVGVLALSSEALEVDPVWDVSVLCGVGYVWDAMAAHSLRVKHGIVGAMVGTLPIFRQQNVVKGLPLILSPNELFCCWQKGVVRLVHGGHLALDMSEGKQSCDNLSPKENVGDTYTPEKWDSLVNSQRKAKLCTEEDSLVEIARSKSHRTVAGNVNGLNSKGKTEISLAGGMLKIDVEGNIFRQTPQLASIQTAAMKDLLGRGYKITPGMKFGVDFLAYPGDPSLFHSQFAIRIVEPDSTISGLEVLAACRVALGSRKRLVFATLKVKSEECFATEETPVCKSESQECSFLHKVRVNVESPSPHMFRGKQSDPHVLVDYLCISADLEFVPIESRSQRPHVQNIHISRIVK